MLPHLSARAARLQPSIMVGVVLRANGGSQYSLQVLLVFVNPYVCGLSSAQAAIMESACAIFELETLSLCTLQSAVVGVEEV